MPDPAGVIDFFLHPPLALQTEILDPRGPYGEGSHTLTETGIGTDAVGTTFGMLVTRHTAPLGWGYSVGFVDVAEGLSLQRYYPPYAQVGVLHQLLVSGANVWTQVENCDLIINLIQWQIARPIAVALYVQPGWEADVYWLRGT